MVNGQFVEFLYPEEALKQQEKFSFLIGKYKRNREELRGFKEDKIKRLAGFLEIIEALEKELYTFKKLLPRSDAGTPRPVSKAEPLKVKKIKKKKIRRKKKSKTKRELDSLKLGLEKIRDELEGM